VHTRTMSSNRAISADFCTVSAEKMFSQYERQRHSLHPWLPGQAVPQGLSGVAPALGA